jgi:hypothetical protein
MLVAALTGAGRRLHDLHAVGISQVLAEPSHAGGVTAPPKQEVAEEVDG